jgi:RNA polymerase primary sigma factor
MDIYMSEATQYPLLNAEEEIELAQRCEAGRAARNQLDDESLLTAVERRRLEGAVRRGQQARRHMIQCNLRLVVSMAGRYSGLGLPISDLVQEGNIGLMKAVDRFDHRRGVRFATYAGWWIQQAMRRAVNRKARLVRLPAWTGNELYRLRTVGKELEIRLGRRPTLPELADRMGVSVRRVRQLQQWDRKVLSLQMPVGDEGDGELGDLISDQDVPSIEEVYSRRRLQEKVRHLVAARCSPREQEILSMRFGLDSGESQTLKEIADELGISRERVRQIEKRALRRLRRSHAQHEFAGIQSQP